MLYTPSIKVTSFSYCTLFSDRRAKEKIDFEKLQQGRNAIFFFPSSKENPLTVRQLHSLKNLLAAVSLIR